MLSEHELVCAVRDEIYPVTEKLMDKCLELNKKSYPHSQDPVNVCGNNELNWTLQKLFASINILRKLAKDHRIDINPEFLKESLIFIDKKDSDFSGSNHLWEKGERDK